MSMFNKIKAVKELRDQAKSMQSALQEITAVGEGARGAVKITMNGVQEILALDINDQLLSDKAKLTQGIKDAFADVSKKLRKEMAANMSKLGGVQEMMKKLGM